MCQGCDKGEIIKGKTTLLFDMYGVILEESKGNFIPYTFNYFDKSEHERLVRQFKEDQLFTQAGNGEMTSDAFLAKLGFGDPQYHMRNYIENYLTLDSGFIAFAEKYYEQYDFVLLSNDVSEWSNYITEYYQLNKYFKNKIVSGDVRCRKPDRRIYELTLERIGKRASECLFIDNSVKNLEVANELGIESILFNRDNEVYTGIVINSFEEFSELLKYHD